MDSLVGGCDSYTMPGGSSSSRSTMAGCAVKLFLLCPPEDVDVSEVHRFEGASDPADESIQFAISMPCGHRGTLPASYGRTRHPMSPTS